MRAITKWVGIAVVAVVISGLVYLVQMEKCFDRCKTAVARGDQLADRGLFMEAIQLIDSIDRDCNCRRFTEGDEPPEHTTMRYCLEQLNMREGQTDTVKIQPKGPLLEMLLGRKE
jgi:hypothetical protein